MVGLCKMYWIKCRKIKAKFTVMIKLGKKYWVGCGIVNLVRTSGVSICKVERVYDKVLLLC